MAVAALVAACGDSPAPVTPKPYSAPAGSAVSLYVTVREELLSTHVVRRLEIATRGTFAEDGSLRLDVSRAELQRRDAEGRVDTITSEKFAAEPGADAAVTRLLESLRASSVQIGLDPERGVTSVEGLDRALDGAVAAGDTSLATERAGLRELCSDDGWRRGLAAAGLCPVPDAADVSPARVTRIRIPGRGETTMQLTGEAGKDEGGVSALHFVGSLRADTAFEGDPGDAPVVAGAVDVAGVSGEATTSYPSRSRAPSQGEWSLTIPFAGGYTIRTTTKFTLVRK